MWTVYRNGITPKKKKKKKKEAVSFPPISSSPFKPPAQDQKTRLTTSQRLQELFFSQTLSDYGPLDRTIKNKKTSGHQVVSYAKLSVETDLEITAHLKNNLQQHHFKLLQDSSAGEKEAELLNFLRSKTFQLKDQALKALFNVSGPLNSRDDAPQLLQILKENEKEEEEENVEENNQDRKILPALSSCTDEAPDRGSSEGTCAGSEAEKKESLFSKQYDEINQDLLDYIKTNNMQEDTDRLCHIKQRRFMIYLCGGYLDTVAERSALMERVYPQLYLYCKQRGYDFRMVDLRRGVTDPISDHNDSAELHIELLKKCQETEGPSFFMFTGQKHEVQSLPTTISQGDFEAILRTVTRDRKKQSKRESEVDDVTVKSQSSLGISNDGSFTLEHRPGEEEEHTGSSALMSENSKSLSSFSDGEKTEADNDQDLGLLQTWYQLDENTVPPVYRLLPVSTHLPDFLSRDGQRRKAAKKAWRSTCLHIWGVLQCNGPEAIGETATSHLLRTVLDWEMEQGLGAKLPAEEYSHCYKRIITDLLYNLRSEYAQQFIDLHKGRPEINQTLHRSQQSFIHNIHSKLRHTNIYETNVSWGRKGLSPKHNRSHQFYTERLCSHFQRIVTTALNRVMQVKPVKRSFDVRRGEASRTRLHEEMQLHLRHGKSLAQSFEFRQNFLLEVKDSLEISASSQNALLLLGEPGSGKSTLMAKVVQLLPTWISGKVKVLVCFVGLTSDSRNVRLLLQMICTQMADIYCKHTEISESLPQLIRELHSLLMLVSEDRPLALVLDGLDELSEEHEADLSWLYTPPPPHVYILLSASKESSAYQVLKSHAKVSLLSLPPLSSEEITAGLRSRLASDARRLQTAQWNLLLQRCLSCPNPLYLSTAYSLSLSWSSFTPPEQTTLPGQLQSLFQGIFASLERKHGEHLLRRAASLLCLSRCGVTEEELLRLLGRDERVTQEIAKLHNQTQTTSGYDSVPFVLWARLRHDIGYHLTQVESDGTWVIHWTHSEFGQVATQRYLKTEDTTRAVHADFAEYYGADGPDSSIFQPLAWSREEGGKRSYVFNLRKLHGLPYHLIRSGQILPLFSQCIFNYEFLLHKLWGLSFCHIEEDLKAAIIPDKDLVDKDMLVQALCLSRSVLLKDPCQLASQLLGRLLHITTQDKPVAPGDPLRYTYLHTLMAQCQHSTLPVLVPSYSCLMPPGGLTHTLLTGHLSPVTALAFGQDHAVSCSVDGTLKLWKLDDTVALARTLPRSEGFTSGWAADSLTLCLKDSVLVLRKGHRLQVREVDSGKVFYTESESLDVPVVTSTGEGRLLVVFYDGSHKVKVFDLAASCSLLRCVNVTLESEPIHKDNSILLSHNSIKDHVFFAYRSGGEAAVFSANSGTVLSVVKAQEQAASIQAVEMSSQYLLLFCRYPYKRDTEIIHIELYSPASFQYLRSILGCSQDYISQVTINRGGTHVIAFCPSNRTVSTEIITWNLETEDHKHMARFPGLLTAGICPDLRFCLGFCSGERYLRLWNLISRINDQTLTYNIHRVQRDGTQEIIPMDKYPSYVVCRGIRTGTVRVWNVSRAHFRGRPVRVEHSLFSSSDVVLAQDLKLYILTDRGTATFTDTPTPVYQTLLVYDLLTRSYVKRQSGLFIVPCPQQDYRLLMGELLLGLSENRDHLIVWDLDSGYIKGRIKTYHKESLLTSSPLKDQQSQTVLTGERKGLMMPWDWRTESNTAKKRRQQFEERREKEEQRNLEREKHNSIDQYLLSGDEKVVICSYFAHHLNVFSVDSQEHLHTLEDRWSLLGLCTAALTHSGGHLAISNYSEVQRSPYLTLWDTQHGRVQKRLKNEPGICCVAITNDASRIAFGIMKSNKLKVWEPFRRKHKTISGYRGLKLDVSSQLYVTEGGTKAILLADELSVWDLDAGTVLSVFTPDSRIQCVSVLGDENCTLHLGFSDTPTLISMTLSKQGLTAASKDKRQDRVFGESSSSEEEDEPEVKRVK
ncbi:hypothetical protein AMEX_G11074 [Astyanax mexicanus]|uniref:Si:ch211-212k18.6 n=1 Tax=Astyanax mexicanus TaxID=7994 RepID=A0A8B9KZ02_ASTMX|nr:hypothetical protein AMEX_G11074 [Astyanax mexicanus]